MAERAISIPNNLRHVDLEQRPASEVVVTGFAMRTRFGNTTETIAARERGDNAIILFEGDTGNENVHVASPLPSEFDPFEGLGLGKEAKWFSPFTALQLSIVRQATEMAGLLGPDGKVDSIDPLKFGIFGYSGIGTSLEFIRINDIVRRNEAVREGIRSGTLPAGTRQENVKVSDPFKGFPEQSNGRVAETLGLKGKGNYGSQACASGAAAFVEGVDSILSGKNTAAIVGATETVLQYYPQLAFASFDAIGALSHSEDPNYASRPLDTNRDGFVMAEGSAYLVLESAESAHKRGAKVYARVAGAETGMDGHEKTRSDQDRVAALIASTVKTPDNNLILPDVWYLHATSTPVGDQSEITAGRNVYGDHINKIAMVANKSAFGHILGAAGAVSLVEAVSALSSGVVAPTINLRERDEAFKDLDVVESARKLDPRNALVTSSGFGGHNAAILLRR